MGQTLGSQAFGSWYDILYWALFSGIFFYVAATSSSWPLATRNKIPAFLLNRKLCIGLGVAFAIVAAGKLFRFF